MLSVCPDRLSYWHAGLVQLESLNLGWCSCIADEDMQGLQDLTCLSDLRLSRTKVHVQPADELISQTADLGIMFSGLDLLSLLSQSLIACKQLKSKSKWVFPNGLCYSSCVTLMCLRQVPNQGLFKLHLHMWQHHQSAAIPALYAMQRSIPLCSTGMAGQ